MYLNRNCNPLSQSDLGTSKDRFWVALSVVFKGCKHMHTKICLQKSTTEMHKIPTYGQVLDCFFWILM